VHEAASGPQPAGCFVGDPGAQYSTTLIWRATRLSESLESFAYQHIKNEIVNADLPAGALLSENELSAKLGISRTPVHSAIVRLEKEGFVESLTKRGFLVKDISITEFFDMHEAIVAMEYYALAQIGRNKGIVDIKRLKMHIDAQKTALEAGDNLAYYLRGFDFSLEILSAAKNETMKNALDSFRDKILCKAIRYRKEHPEKKPIHLVSRNEGIYRALLDDNIQKAQELLVDDLESVWEFLNPRFTTRVSGEHTYASASM
jgi:DNA-binding GntR family transcriptional regulator